MGYYANGSGTITFSGLLTDKQKEAIDRIVGDIWYECEFCRDTRDQSHDVLDLWCSDKYYYDTGETLNVIANTAPVESGYLNFAGEDGDIWRFVFDKKTNRFIEEYGEIVYQGDAPLKWDNAGEFVGQIIDLFEDFLESKGIKIPNDEKEQSENPAILYGTDYEFLQSGIEETLMNWKLLPDPVSGKPL